MDSNDSEIVDIIRGIKSSEEKAAEIRNTAHNDADKIIKSSMEKLAEKKTKTEERVVSKKNKLLKEGVSKIDSKVSSILLESKHGASKLGNKRLKQKQKDSLFDMLFE